MGILGYFDKENLTPLEYIHALFSYFNASPEKAKEIETRIQEDKKSLSHLPHGWAVDCK